MAGELDALARTLDEALGLALHPDRISRVSGGSINECYRCLSAAGPAIFLKITSAAERAMFETEAAGLAELESAHAVRVPRVLGQGATHEHAWLALEWITFGRTTAKSAAALGEQLARQHRVSATSFGWQQNNTIGRTPQHNRWHQDWVTFFRDQRLRYQLDLARRNGHDGRLQARGRRLLECVGEFFATYRPVASLLHGDLWGGNWATDEADQPVIFDPAVYYGDREADLAMTRLFGGYPAEFYAAYAAGWPPDAGAATRVDLYNLYHVLNHLNLFGSGYRAHAVTLMDRLLAELGH